jgi:multiple sugar transport system substrate-binding protein
MTTRHPVRTNFPVSRRRFLQGTTTLAVAGLPGGARARAQTPAGSDFTREASITSWGFGAEETNPMAFSRIDAFNQAYPNIELELVPTFEDQQLLTGFASSQLPDLIWTGREKIASWVSRDLLMPLDDMLANSGIDTSQFYPSAWEQVQVDGKVYGIPQFIDVRALYVNNDALQEVSQDPTQLDTSNWDALADLGAQLVKKSGDAYERWGFDHKIQAQWLWLWARGNGGQLMSDDGTEITFDDAKAVEALDWGVKAYDAQGGFQSYEAFATTWQGDEQFARGQVAMTLYENWMMGIVARVTPDMNFSVLPILERGGTGMVSFTGGPAWLIPNGANDAEATFEFIQFMCRPETWMIGAQAVKDARVSENAPYIPSLTANSVVDQMQIDDLYESLGGQFDEAVQLWPQLLQEAFSLPLAKSPVGVQVGDALQNDGVLPALRGEMSAEEALQQADQAAEDAVESQ